MTAKHNLWAFYQGHRHLVDLTPLNARLSARYQACEANGGHQPSGEELVREVKGLPHVFQVCRRCTVPYSRSQP